MIAHMLLFADAQPLISWGKAALEFLGFLPYFAIYGALGFRLVVLRRDGESRAVSDPGADFFAIAERGAARVGLLGAVLLLISLAANTAWNSYTAHVGIIEAARSGGSKLLTPVVFGFLFLAAFGLALARARWAWCAAAVVAVGFALRTLPGGQWATLVNPLHEVGAGLWLGTLFVLVVAGLPAILFGATSRERRGPLVAELLSRFSPLALTAAALLGITGVITAWRHLKYVAAIWTTPYGYALDAKLAVVAIVLALGAWNWRRMVPKLGAEDSAHALRRSSTAELIFALIVLLITAILVVLPSPKLPG